MTHQQQHREPIGAASATAHHPIPEPAVDAPKLSERVLEAVTELVTLQRRVAIKDVLYRVGQSLEIVIIVVQALVLDGVLVGPHPGWETYTQNTWVRLPSPLLPGIDWRLIYQDDTSV